MSDSEETKYDNAVIYKLICADGHYYYGSTTNHKSRHENHKKQSILRPNNPLYKHINTIGWDNVTFKIIEYYPCNNNEELTKQEDTYIKASKDANDELCLNTNRAYTSYKEKQENMKEYYEMHKEELLQYQRDYREENAEKIKEYHDVYNVLNAEKKIAYSKEYREKNREKVLEGNRIYYEKNKEAILEKGKIYAAAHKEEYAAYKKAHYEENKERIDAERKEYRVTHAEEIKERGKKYYEENKEVILEKFKEYREKTKESTKEYMKAYREKNKEAVSEKHQCECGGVYTMNHKAIHSNSKKHLKHTLRLDK